MPLRKLRLFVAESYRLSLVAPQPLDRAIKEKI